MIPPANARPFSTPFPSSYSSFPVAAPPLIRLWRGPRRHHYYCCRQQQRKWERHLESIVKTLTSLSHPTPAKEPLRFPWGENGVKVGYGRRGLEVWSARGTAALKRQGNVLGGCYRSGDKYLPTETALPAPTQEST